MATLQVTSAASACEVEPTAGVPPDFRPKLWNDVYLIRRELLGAVQRHAPRLQGRLLDFGCGRKPYRTLFAVSEYVGVDFANEGHAHEGEPIDYFYDGKRLPFPDASFDSVLTTEVLEHIFNPDEALAELARVLRPGGRMLLTCPFAWELHEEPHDYARYTPHALRALLDRAGFDVEVHERAGSAVRALGQLSVLTTTRTLRRMFQHAPRFLRGPIVRGSWVALNLWTLLWDAVLPRIDHIYLSNVVLAQRRREPSAP